MTVCPTCGGEFASDIGVKVHHAKSHNESLSDSTKQCIECESAFESYKDSSKFCSISCHNDYVDKNGQPWTEKTGKITRSCKQCDGDIETWPSDDKKFCNHKCYSAWLSDNKSGEDHPQYDPEFHVTTSCHYCGEEVKINKFEKEEYDKHFCDRSCQNNWQSSERVGENAPNWKGGTVENICDECDTKFESPRSGGTRYNRFCSNECSSEWRSKHMSEIIDSDKMTGEDNPNWKGGRGKWYPDKQQWISNIGYGENWSSVREDVLNRDNHKCVICGKEQNDNLIDVHHIIPRSEFDILENSNTMNNLVTLCREHHSRLEQMNKEEQLEAINRGEGR
jgi:hypothetical protein